MSYYLIYPTLERNVCSAAIGWNVLYMTVKSTLSKVWFCTNVSLLILCLDNLSIADSAVLKSLNIIKFLSISTFRYISVCLIFLVCLYVYDCYIFFYVSTPLSLYNDLLCLLFPFFDSKSILFAISMTIPAFFWFPLA